ncbi:MAG: sporulation protein YqfD [Oscillospiraceae bacterium]
MLFVRILNFLKGYLIICAEGCFIERFINICLRRNILLWDIKKNGDRKTTAKMSIRAFKEIRQVAWRTKTKVKIVERCGFPFFLQRYKKRKLALLGLVIFVGLLWYTSTHVMGITIYGNVRIPTETIKAELALKNIDKKHVQNRMVTTSNDIAWVGININGSRIYVEIVERIPNSPRLDESEPCNIISKSDGVIERLEVKNGQTMVKIGDGVRKGDVLVSGIMDNSAMGFRYVHAFGEVYATTIYKKSLEYPLEFQDKLYTGNETVRYGIQILNFNMNFFFNNRQPYSECEKTQELQEYTPPVDILPSLYLKKNIYKEQNLVNKTRTIDEAVSCGTKELTEQIESELPPGAKIKNKTVTHLKTEFNSVVVTLEIQCSENISEEIMIDKSDIVDYDIGKENSTANDAKEDNG